MILGVSLRVFPNKISIWTGRWSQADVGGSHPVNWINKRPRREWSLSVFGLDWNLHHQCSWLSEFGLGPKAHHSLSSPVLACVGTSGFHKRVNQFFLTSLPLSSACSISPANSEDEAFLISCQKVPLLLMRLLGEGTAAELDRSEVWAPRVNRDGQGHGLVWPAQPSRRQR